MFKTPNTLRILLKFEVTKLGTYLASISTAMTFSTGYVAEPQENL